MTVLKPDNRGQLSPYPIKPVVLCGLCLIALHEIVGLSEPPRTTVEVLAVGCAVAVIAFATLLKTSFSGRSE